MNRDAFDFAVEQIEKLRLANVHHGGGMRVRFEVTKETRRWWSEHPEHTSIDSVIVESAAWMPRHKSFLLRFRDGSSLDVTTEPTMGELVWLNVGGYDVGVKAEGMPISEAHHYLGLMDEVWEALRRGGEHAVIGQRFRFSPPVRLPT